MQDLSMHLSQPPSLALAQEAPSPVAPANALPEAELQALQQAAVKFEAFFVAQMLQQMRQATAALADADSPLRDEVNQMPLSMADHAVADSLAGTRAFGIADVLVQQMSAPLRAATSPLPLAAAAAPRSTS